MDRHIISQPYPLFLGYVIGEDESRIRVERVIGWKRVVGDYYSDEMEPITVDHGPSVNARSFTKQPGSLYVYRNTPIDAYDAMCSLVAHRKSQKKG